MPELWWVEGWGERWPTPRSVREVNTQLTFDSILAAPHRRAPHNGRQTSRAAARRIEPISGRLCQQVLAAVRASGFRGMTRPELESALNMDGSTLRPRVVALLAAGALAEPGETRLTESGRHASVLIAVPK